MTFKDILKLRSAVICTGLVGPLVCGQEGKGNRRIDAVGLVMTSCGCIVFMGQNNNSISASGADLVAATVITAGVTAI